LKGKKHILRTKKSKRIGFCSTTSEHDCPYQSIRALIVDSFESPQEEDHRKSDRYKGESRDVIVELVSKKKFDREICTWIVITEKQ